MHAKVRIIIEKLGLNIKKYTATAKKITIQNSKFTIILYLCSQNMAIWWQ
jgi:hypothetical protein